jgi:ATP-dependent protease HslVU (ClpYQ) peptidase subunit
MTCIIGLFDKENDCVYVGADSLASRWNDKFLMKTRKVFKAKDNKNIVMAICGSVKLQNFLSIEEDLIEEIKELKNEVNFEHIVKYTTPKIISSAKKYNCCKESGSDVNIHGDIIFAYKNQLYLIDCEGGVWEAYDEYVASGCGADFAMAVLSQNKDKPVVERITEALTASEKHGVGVERPFYIMNTKNDEVVTIKE